MYSQTGSLAITALACRDNKQGFYSGNKAQSVIPHKQDFNKYACLGIFNDGILIAIRP